MRRIAVRLGRKCAENEGLGGSVPGITALVVDDDPALRRVLRRVFERDEATVVEAADEPTMARVRDDVLAIVRGEHR